jgi:hypothetical protein
MPPGPDPALLPPPDIEPYRIGNTGLPWVTSFDSFRPGPHVMIAALTHGNELCGAHALVFLHESGFRPIRGMLTLGFLNVAAYRRFAARNPQAARFVDEDLNRVWGETQLGDGLRTIERERARALRPLIDTVDLLLDIHSMQHVSPPLVLAGMQPKSVALARRLRLPGTIVRDAGHAAGKRLRDYGPFDDPSVPATALLVECGQHWQRQSADVAKAAALRFLDGLDLMDPTYRTRYAATLPPPEPPRVIEVTETVMVTGRDFAFTQPFTGLELIPKAGTIIAHEGGRPIVTPYDDCVLVMPSRRLTPGQTAVRLGRYVD